MSQSQSPSAANTRRYVVIHESASEGAYGFRSGEELAVRLDGSRFRHRYFGFQWRGQQGGVEHHEVYLVEVDARALWDEYFAGAHEGSFDEVVAAALKR
jgi:hypothetical protein